MKIAKTDANQAEIIKALRSVGASVHAMHKVGEGFPDLIVGFMGVNYLLEVKLEAAKGKVKPSESKLNELQVKFHESWKGQVAVVRNKSEALTAIGIKL